MLKRPVVWAHEKGLYILDWDEWRGANDLSITVEISEEEFDRRAAMCTVAKIDDLRKAGWNV